MKLQNLVIEVRSNPNLNKTESIYQQLKKMSENAEVLPNGKKNLFVSFTKVPKLGINPVSVYDVSGIYGYPIEFILDKLHGDINPKVAAIPFANDRPYLQIFKFKPSAEIAYCDEKPINSNKKDAIVHELKTNGYLKKAIDFDSLTFNHLIKMMVNSYNEDGAKANAAFRRVGFDGVYDNGTSSVHSNEPYQVFALHFGAIEHLDTIINPKAASVGDYKNSIKPSIGKTDSEKNVSSSAITSSVLSIADFSVYGGRVSNSEINKVIDTLTNIGEHGVIVDKLDEMVKHLSTEVDFNLMNISDNPRLFKTMVKSIYSALIVLKRVISGVLSEVEGLDVSNVLDYMDGIENRLRGHSEIWNYVNSTHFLNLFNQFKDDDSSWRTVWLKFDGNVLQKFKFLSTVRISPAHVSFKFAQATCLIKFIEYVINNDDMHGMDSD